MKFYLSFLLLTAQVVLGGQARFYVGTYTDKSPSQGIYTGLLDTETGQLGPLELAASAPSPNFLALAPGKRTLYAVVATNGGAVAAFRVKATGKLEYLNHLPSGSGGCHVAVDATGRTVVVANYSGGSLAVFCASADGALEKLAALIPFTGSGPNPKRQDKPHLHAGYFSLDNRNFYACDLGTDSIWQYRLSGAPGELQPLSPPAAKVPPGSGPRHLALSPDRKFAFVNGEMHLNVTALARDEKSGTFELRQTVALMPAGADTNGLTSAEIFCHPSGQWLYVSVRDTAGQGRDELVVLSADKTGRLERIQNFSAGVKVPRGFGIDPSGRWLLVGGQADNRLAVLKIDPATGKLSATEESVAVGAPVCVIFADEKR